MSHIRHIHNALDTLDGVTVYGPRGNRPRVATLSFNIDGMPSTQVGEMLDADYHVCVRAGLHPATSPTATIWSTRSGRSPSSRSSRGPGGVRPPHE